MNDQAWVLETDGTKRKVTPKDGKEFTLEEVYDLVGCETVEQIQTKDRDMCLLVDEDGKFKDLEVNIQASELAQGFMFMGDEVVGRALYCSREYFS